MSIHQSKIIQAISQMGEITILDDSPKRLVSIRISIICPGCCTPHNVTVGAVYRQHKRGRTEYRCPSCAGKQGWDDPNKLAASERSKQKWNDPGFAGVVTGKAIARDIRRLTSD